MTTSSQPNVTTDANSNLTQRTSCSSSVSDSAATRIVCFVFGVLFLSVSCYMFLMLCNSLHRFLRTKLRRTPSVNTSAMLANSNRKLGLSMRFVATIVSLLCVVHYTVQVVVVYADCCIKVLEMFKILIYGLIASLTYAFFWLRQRVLYDAPAMRLFHTKLLRTSSWACLSLIVVEGIAQIISTIFLLGEYESPGIRLSWLIGCILIHAVLMALFLYPLRKHNNKKRGYAYGYYEKRRSSQKKPKRSLESKDFYSIENGIRDSNIFTVSSEVDPKGRTFSVKRSALSSSNPLQDAAKRCVTCAVLVFASDILAGSVETASLYQEWESEGFQIVKNVLSSFSLMTNAICVVVSFGTWRRMLFPDCIKSFLAKTYCFQMKRTLHDNVFDTISYQAR